MYLKRIQKINKLLKKQKKFLKIKKHSSMTYKGIENNKLNYYSFGFINNKSSFTNQTTSLKLDTNTSILIDNDTAIIKIKYIPQINYNLEKDPNNYQITNIQNMAIVFDTVGLPYDHVNMSSGTSILPIEFNENENINMIWQKINNKFNSTGLNKLLGNLIQPSQGEIKSIRG